MACCCGKRLSTVSSRSSIHCDGVISECVRCEVLRCELLEEKSTVIKEQGGAREEGGGGGREEGGEGGR